jgi:hypothetical protein
MAVHRVEAKKRIEQLFAQTDVRSRSHHLAIAQRVRDQLMQRCTVADDEATECLGELISSIRRSFADAGKNCPPGSFDKSLLGRC